MRRLLTLLICLTMLIPALPATAEAAEQRLVIAITSEESALNLPLEEAFFKANPGVTVVQFKSAGQPFDDQSGGF